ncbi:MAG: hypothetical protein JJU06_08315 [Ectothiorhodospiraceae bacterium]|nr:hypothetical protein [Ectothiorhodospiraceae bacterium]MCH8506804.1 hypothetical protein [Ectothiorhodospiraceae bacterium]
MSATRGQPRRRERLIALAIIGFLLLNYPLLAIFATDIRVLGLPLLWVYLFAAWVLIIACTGFLLRRGRGPRQDGQP